MKEYCYECDDFVEVTYRIEEIKSQIGDYLVKYAGDVVYCNKCGAEVYVREVSDVNITQYDLLINDFEPVTGWAAKKAGVPSLSISHQAAYLHHVPKYNQGFLDKLITQHFAPT